MGRRPDPGGACARGRKGAGTSEVDDQPVPGADDVQRIAVAGDFLEPAGLAQDVLELVAADPTLAQPLHARGRVIRAEAIIAARDEGARTLADILIRRTRLAVQTLDRAESCARDTAALVAPLLGWDEARIESEVARLLAEQPEVPARPR